MASSVSDEKSAFIWFIVPLHVMSNLFFFGCLQNVFFIFYCHQFFNLSWQIYWEFLRCLSSNKRNDQLLFLQILSLSHSLCPLFLERLFTCKLELRHVPPVPNDWFFFDSFGLSVVIFNIFIQQTFSFTSLSIVTLVDIFVS